MKANARLNAPIRVYLICRPLFTQVDAAGERTSQTAVKKRHRCAMVHAGTDDRWLTQCGRKRKRRQSNSLKERQHAFYDRQTALCSCLRVCKRVLLVPQRAGNVPRRIYARSRALRAATSVTHVPLLNWTLERGGALGDASVPFRISIEKVHG